MKIMSLDLSTKCSGWAVFDENKLEAHGCITATSDDVIKRINKMAAEVAKLLDQYKPNKVVLEDPLPADVRHNIEVYKKLTWTQGFVVNEIHSRGIPYELVVASHWRKLCGISTGRGIKRGSLKDADINFVKEKFDVTVGDDEADAISIGWAAVVEGNKNKGAW